MSRADFSRDYTIYTPQLKSDTRKSLRVNKNLGNFTYDFSSCALDKFGLYSVSFCFFILWEEHLSGDLNQKNIWFKKEISIAGDGIINLSDTDCFDRKFLDDEPLPTVKRKQEFFARYGLDSSYLVIRDLKKNFDLEPSQNVAIRVVYDKAADRLIKKPVSLEELQSLLIENSNGPVRINKTLNYYETELEKYLQITCQKTGALFPGDCDMLLFDKTYACKFIVEFKKATSKDCTPVKDQSFLNYIRRDKNKYTRLNILRNYFSQKDARTIPFVTVFYSVKEGQEDQIKLEIIDPSLKLEKSDVFSIGSDPVANQTLILRRIIEACDEQ